MDSFFKATADFCESIFAVAPGFGSYVNKTFIAIAFVATFIWVAYMIRSAKKPS